MSDSQRVVLTLPARDEYARTVRIVAAELAARAGMNIDDVDDVKLAVEEAFVFTSERGPAEGLTFVFEVADGSVTLTVGPFAAETGPDEADAGERYARFILESVCDEFELTGSEGSCYLRLVKRPV